MTLVDRQVDLVEEGFDVGIVIARQVRSSSVVTRRLTTGCMTVCATPAYLETHGTPTRPEDLLAHPCLSLPSEYWGDERVFTGPEGEVRVRPSNVIVANNTEMLRQFALLGMGIAILPSYLIGNDTTRGNPGAAAFRLPAAAGRDQRRVSEPPPFAGEGAHVHRSPGRAFQPDAESPARRAVVKDGLGQAGSRRVER